MIIGLNLHLFHNLTVQYSLFSREDFCIGWQMLNGNIRQKRMVDWQENSKLFDSSFPSSLFLRFAHSISLSHIRRDYKSPQMSILSVSFSSYRHMNALKYLLFTSFPLKSRRLWSYLEEWTKGESCLFMHLNCLLGVVWRSKLVQYSQITFFLVSLGSIL